MQHYGASYRVQDGLVHINRQLQSNLSGEEEREIGRPISVSNFHFRTVKRPNMWTSTLFKVFLLNANFAEPHLSMCVRQIYFRKVFTSSGRGYNWHRVPVWRLPDQAWWRAFTLGELSSSTSTSFFYHGDVGLQSATPWLGVRA